MVAMTMTNAQAERVLIAVCLLEPARLFRIHVHASDFCEPANRMIWSAMRRLAALGKAVTAEAVELALETEGVVIPPSTLAYLVACCYDGGDTLKRCAQ